MVAEKNKGKGKGKVIAALLALKGKGKGKPARKEETNPPLKPVKLEKKKTFEAPTPETTAVSKKRGVVRQASKENAEEQLEKRRSKALNEQDRSDREDQENVTPKSAKTRKAKDSLWSDASKEPSTEDKDNVRPKGPKKSKTKEGLLSEVAETKKNKKKNAIREEGEDEVVEKPKKIRKGVTADEGESPTVPKPKPPRDAVGLEDNCDEEQEVGETVEEKCPKGNKRKKMVGTVSRDASKLRLRTKTSLDSLPETETPARKRVDAPSPSVSTPSTSAGGFLDPIF